MEKDHLAIILESIDNKFQLVLEGHEALRSEIRGARDESNEKHEHTAFLINVLNDKIDTVSDDLKSHRADTESHHGLYCVKES